MISAIDRAISKFEQVERGIPQARIAAKLIAELRAVLPATPPQRPANCGTGFCSCLECPHEDTAPLLIRLRTLEVDHDPDGWPAICMRDVTALLDMIDLLREDKTRIDWLADPANTIGNVQLPIHCVHANLHSLRAAIDMAREITP